MDDSFRFGPPPDDGVPRIQRVTTAAGLTAGGPQALLGLIRNAEAEGRYNIQFGERRSSTDLSQLTVNQVLDMQRQRVRSGSPSSAVGGYQLIRQTLQGLVRQAGLTGEERFTPELQDQLALKLLDQRGYQDFKAGRISADQFADNLAKEWASLPTSAGKSHYAGDGLNASRVSRSALLRALAGEGATMNVPAEYATAFESEGARSGVDPNVLAAVSDEGSAFNPLAVGSPGPFGKRRGLMMFPPDREKQYGVDPVNPQQSIAGAASYLGDLQTKYGDPRLALAAYQWGEDNVNAWLANGADPKAMPTDTRSYVDAVLAKASGGMGDPAFREHTEQLEANRQLDRRHADLDEQAPGRYSVIDADQVDSWKADWEKNNRSTGVLGDTARLLESGNAALGLATREAVGMIPGIGPKIVSGLDSIDEWFTGSNPKQRMTEAMDRADASMTPAQQSAMQKRWWDSDKGTLGPAWTDPRAYFGGIVESLPATVVTMAPGMLLARGAFTGAVAAGASRKVAAAAAARTAAISGALLEGIQGGGDSARQVRQQVEQLPIGTLRQSSAFRALIDQGMSEDDARAAIAGDVATQAFMLSGVVTGAFGGMGDRTLAKIVGEGVGGTLWRRIAVGAGKDVIGEGVLEELPQNVGQQIAQNRAMQTADPNQSLTEGVGEAAASGVAVGGAMGGLMGGAGGAMSQAEPEHAPSAAAAPAEVVAPPRTRTPGLGPIGAALEHGRTVMAGAPPASPPAPATTDPAATQDPAQARPEPAPSTAVAPFPVGSTVLVDDPSVPRFTARVESYADGEAIVSDEATGEVFQVPFAVMKPATAASAPINAEIVPEQPAEGGAASAAPSAPEAATAPPAETGTETVIRDPGGPDDNTPFTVSPDQAGVSAGMVRGTLPDGSEKTIGRRLLETRPQPMPTPAGPDLKTMDDDQLHQRLDFLQQQARQSGWTKPLRAARDEVQAVLDDRKPPTAAPVAPAADGAAPAPTPPAIDYERRWDTEFSADDRKAALDKAGIKRSPGNKWAQFSDAIKAKLLPDLDAGAAAPAEPPKVVSFTTAKGSTYRVNGGSTTRNKAARSDVGHEGDSGPKPASERTYYVTADDAERLSVFQTQGEKKSISSPPSRPDTIGVRYDSGPDAGKFEARTVVAPQSGPAIGLTPVEIWDGGRTVHFGNPITSVQTVDDLAHEAATSPQNDLPEPTPAQKEAGNYRKGHIALGGLDISIENPTGSTRAGTDASGKPWSVTMQSHYGYIRGTVGKDKDHIDVFIRPGTETVEDDAPIFVIDQRNAAGTFDEHKVMIGFLSGAEARRAYLANYSKGWKGFGALTRMDMSEFKAWLATGDTTKPAKGEGQTVSLSPADAWTGEPTIAELAATLPPPVKSTPEEIRARREARNRTTERPTPTLDAFSKMKEAMADLDRRLASATTQEEYDALEAEAQTARDEWNSALRKAGESVPAPPKRPAQATSPETAAAPSAEPVSFSAGEVDETVSKARDAVRQQARSTLAGKTVRTADGDDVMINWQGIKHGTANASRPALAAMLHIDDLLQASSKDSTSADKHGRAGIKAVHRYRAKAMLDGKPADVLLFVREHADGRRYYDHAVIESGPSGTSGGGSPEATRASQPSEGPEQKIETETPTRKVAGEPAVTSPPSPNTIFTEDAAEKARAVLRAKLRGQLNSGIDPEVLQAGITLAGYHIEKGARTFAAFAKAMVADLGDGVRPYLKSWYMGVKYDPRAAGFDGMSSAADVEAADVAVGTENADDAGKLEGDGAAVPEGPAAGPAEVAPAVREAAGSPRSGGGEDVSGRKRTRGRRDETGRSVRSGEPGLPLPEGSERSPVAVAAPTSTAAADANATDALPPPVASIPAAQTPFDFTITSDNEIGAGGAKTKFRGNVAAITLLREIEAAGRPATREEQATLAKFVGWGGLQAAFAKEDGSVTGGWDREAAELKALLSPDQLAAAASSTRNAHYTSPEVVNAMWSAVQRLGFTTGRVLEPSVGVGNFFGFMPPDQRAASQLTGIELDPITGGIARLLYPGADITAGVGFEKITTPDGYFDLAIGNPPFGGERLYDPKRKALNKFSIHNFFFAKSLDSLRPNGVLAMVVTNSMMDAVGDAPRSYIAARAELLGAIRLPNNAFAKNAGTDVTTDIIFLRRLGPDEKPTGETWAKVETVKGADGKDVPLNEYFVRYPKMMLGDFGLYGSMYRGDMPALVAREGQDTATELARAIAALPADVMGAPGKQSGDAPVVVTKGIDTALVGSGFIADDGSIHVRGEDVVGKPTSHAIDFPNESAKARVAGMIRLRDVFAELRRQQISETATDERLANLRERLNKVYDAFASKHGPINADANKRLFRDDPTWPQISALEEGFDRGVSAAIAARTGETVRAPSARKAAVFSKRTQFPYRAVTSASSAKDALTASLSEVGRVDMGLMQQLYGKTEDAIVSELGPLLFRAPDGTYQTADDYLSGNVKAKLAQAEDAAKADNGLERNIAALRDVIPADIDAVDINVKPGAPWLPAPYVADFLNHIGETKGSRAVYARAAAKWTTEMGRASAPAELRFGTDRADVAQLAEHVLNGTQIQIYDQGRDGPVLNQAATEAANEKAAKIREEWGRWIWEEDARRTALHRLYNDTFNTEVRRAYDGSHLTFPGKVSDDIIALRPHQKNAVWRGIQGKPMLLDHTVGAGKTFTMIATIMEKRRMGLARKPMLVVPNHLVGQWASAFIQLYPGAKVLAATKADFEAANRKRLFARIATGDWDAVIVAHSSFGKIPVSPEFERRFIEQTVADIEQSISELRRAMGEKSRNVKQLAKSRDTQRAKLQALLDQAGKDVGLTFEELGIDDLNVDEMHEFKNLAFSTSQQRVAGLGNPAGSQKASDMFMKVTSVLERTGGRNFTSATGTPLSNTMAEMFTMQRYHGYKRLQQLGITHFDAWAKTFAEIVSDWELSPSGKYKLTSRFAKFVNMPELMQLYRDFADVVTNDLIQAQLAASGKRLPIPKIKGGKPTNIIVPRNDRQAAYIGVPKVDDQGVERYPQGSIVWRSENLPTKATVGSDNMLKIMSDARKAALDMRMIDPQAPDFPDSKVQIVADNVLRLYRTHAADRGTQLVFIDLSTPKKARAAEQARIQALLDKAEAGDEAAQEAVDELTPDELDALNGKFSVYDDLKDKLVARGIPASEIAFIHDANTEAQKEELFGKVRSGRVRVLFGSTAKMGAGTNVQDRIVALHHVDAPWRPSDLEQRDGRGIRQGNVLYAADPDGFEIEILRYATKNTLDARQWQTIESKARFIQQVRVGDSSTREIEDIAGEAANAAEMKAAASGNPAILEEMTLRTQIRRLDAQRTEHDREQHRIKARISDQAAEAARLKTTAANKEKDAAAVAEIEGPVPLQIGRETFTKAKEIGQSVLGAIRQLRESGRRDERLGTYGPFTVFIETGPRGQEKAAVITIDGASSTDIWIDDVETQSDVGLGVRMANQLRDLEAQADAARSRIASIDEQRPRLEAQIKPFGATEELASLRARHAAVIDQLRPKAKETQDAAVAQDIGATPELPETPEPPLPEPERVATLALLKKAQRDLAAGRIDHDTFVARIDALAAALDSRNDTRKERSAATDRLRGEPWLRERLMRARRTGELHRPMVDFALWLLDRNPNLAEDLGISLRQSTETSGAGTYDPVTRIVTLFKGSANDGTAVHEILHHAEAMMPPDVQMAIRREHLKAWKAALEAAEGNEPRLDALLDMGRAALGDQEAYERVVKAFRQGVLDYSRDYALVNSSEFWAVKATRLLQARQVASGNWIREARRWLLDLIEYAKSAFRLPSDAPILRGLRRVLNGTGEQLSPTLLAELAAGPRQDLPSPEEMATRAVEQVKGKILDVTPAVLAAVPLNYFSELARPGMTAIPEYLRTKRKLDAYRGTKHAAADQIAQRWLKLARGGSTVIRDLSSLMHDATLAQVDPSKTDAETRAKPGYDALRNRWDALPAAAQQIFADVREAYKANARELDAILIENVKKAMSTAARAAERRYRVEADQIRSQNIPYEEKQALEAEALARMAKAKKKTEWSMKARLSKMRASFESNRIGEPYFPLARFGQYFLTVRDADGTVLSFSRRESKADRERLERDMRAAYPGKSIQAGILTSNDDLHRAMDPRVMAEIEEILGKSAVGDDVMDEIWQRYLEGLPDLSTRKRFIHRQGTAGYADDALRAFGNHMFHAAHQFGRLKYGPDLQELVEVASEQADRGETQADIDGGKVLANELRLRQQWVMNPQGSAFAHKATSLAFIWFLAMTPAAALVNMAQTTVVGIPMLGARFGLTKATAAISRAAATVLQGRGHAENASLTDDERAAMKDFYESGLVDRTQSHDLAGIGDTGAEYSALRARVMSKLSFLFHHTERLNREVTALAAYRLAKSAGSAHAAAIEAAHELTWKTHFDYSNSSRPRVMQGNIPRVMLTFRNYTINMLFRLFRDIHQSFKGDTPAARREARTQLIGLMGMMALHAGVRGMPFFGIAMAVLGLAFDDKDDPFTFEDKFKASTIDALGPQLGGLVLNGVPGHLLNIDLVNRLGMPNLWFQSSGRDLDGQDEYNYWVSQLLGAVPGIAENAFRGLEMIKEGNVYRGVEAMAPKQIKDLMRAYRFWSEGAQTLRGDTYLGRDDITTWNVIGQAMGFTPAALVETYERNNALKNAEKRVVDARRTLLNRYALARSTGDAEALRQVIGQIRDFNAVPIHRGIQITNKTIKLSLAARQRTSDKMHDGVMIQDKELGADLREKLPAAIYRD